jgi:hypothetical protein
MIEKGTLMTQIVARKVLRHQSLGAKETKKFTLKKQENGAKETLTNTRLKRQLVMLCGMEGL